MQRREIAGGRGMARLRLQGASHAALGVLDRALRIAREAKIDPGVGEARAQFGGDGESLLGPRRLAGGDPGLTEPVVGFSAVGLGEAGVAGRFESRLHVSTLQGDAEVSQPPDDLEPIKASGRRNDR